MSEIPGQGTEGTPIPVEILIAREVEILRDHVKGAIGPTEGIPSMPGAFRTWEWAEEGGAKIVVTERKLPGQPSKTDTQVLVGGQDTPQSEWRLEQEGNDPATAKLFRFVANAQSETPQLASTPLQDIEAMKALAQRLAALTYAQPNEGN
ncbi:MAG TPA: hypothetical protein VMY99_01440 [Nevskiaceae bacterium]|nr:hypothetical protein [Nevskiaceae bacterium]